jgi:hypothetical protein
MEQNTYNLIEFITKNKNYKHIEFFARVRQNKWESKYKGYNDFINFIKFKYSLFQILYLRCHQACGILSKPPLLSVLAYFIDIFKFL